MVLPEGILSDREAALEGLLSDLKGLLSDLEGLLSDHGADGVLIGARDGAAGGAPV